MDKICDIPCLLVQPRYSYVRMMGRECLIDALENWKNYVIDNYEGNPAGYLMANSCYRPKADLNNGLEKGISKNDYYVDFTDANGHWMGCAIDFSARLTSWSFWGDNCPKWRRDDIRDSLVACGLFLPWYWKHGTVNGEILEHWHMSVELTPWTQSKAYRKTPPHWWDNLRG